MQHNYAEVAAEIEKRDVIASVAYALWEERKRRNLPDDPEADWLQAKELVEDLQKLQQLTAQ